MKKLLIILASLLLLLIISVSVLAYVIIGQPEYSLWKFKQAYDAHDATTAQQYMDVPVVAKQITDAAVTKVTHTLGTKKIGGFMDLLLPTITEKIQQQVEQQLLASFAGQPSTIQLFQNSSTISVQDVLTRKKFFCAQTSNAATCTITNEGKTVVLQLQPSTNRTWKIVGVENIDEVMQDTFDTMLEAIK